MRRFGPLLVALVAVAAACHRSDAQEDAGTGACLDGTDSCPPGCYASSGWRRNPTANCVEKVAPAFCSAEPMGSWAFFCVARDSTGDLFGIPELVGVCDSCTDWRFCTPAEQTLVSDALRTVCGQEAPDCGDAGAECNWGEGVCSRCGALADGICCTGDTHCCRDFTTFPYQPFCEVSGVSCPAGPPGPLDAGS